MKITATQLRQIIREEAERLTETEQGTSPSSGAAKKAEIALDKITGSSSLTQHLKTLANSSGTEGLKTLFQGMLDILHEANPKLSTANIVNALKAVAAEEKQAQANR